MEALLHLKFERGTPTSISGSLGNMINVIGLGVYRNFREIEPAEIMDGIRFGGIAIIKTRS